MTYYTTRHHPAAFSIDNPLSCLPIESPIVPNGHHNFSLDRDICCLDMLGCDYYTVDDEKIIFLIRHFGVGIEHEVTVRWSAVVENFGGGSFELAYLANQTS